MINRLDIDCDKCQNTGLIPAVDRRRKSSTHGAVITVGCDECSLDYADNVVRKQQETIDRLTAALRDCATLMRTLPDLGYTDPDSGKPISWSPDGALAVAEQLLKELDDD